MRLTQAQASGGQLNSGAPVADRRPLGAAPAAPPDQPQVPADADPRRVRSPRRKSFEEFLRNDARVPGRGGQHHPYSFAGREALLAVVRLVDLILGHPASPAGRRRLKDAEVSFAGGAQFGKTLLELNLAAYLTGQHFLNFGLYLPDDDLVGGLVDAKFRPDVVDQIEWFAEMVQVGKALNKSGRAVNRKGAFLVTDGQRTALGMIRGLGKVPTTFSMDVAALDEVDDLQPRMMKFVRGRLTASDVRLLIKIGTQRIHGRGMNQAWREGSQGVFLFQCPSCGRRLNPEEEFPGIVRLRAGADARPGACPLVRAPQLTWAGDFRAPGEADGGRAIAHHPLNQYYLGCPACGAELDRTRPVAEHRRPALIAQQRWSFRLSQLAVGAIELPQIVARFQSAVADPEELVVFRCDVLGLPQSSSQALTPAILERARTTEPFDLAPRPRAGRLAYGGLDMGDRCWLWAREAGGAGGDRLLAAERISAGDVAARVPGWFERLGLTTLLIDERPLVNEARTLALALNGLQSLAVWPRIADPRTALVRLPGGLTWDGKNARWQNLKCALVRFSKTKLGAGVEQTLVFFEEGGQTKFVPCVAVNRFETIDRAVREWLTPAEGVIEILPDGTVRETPALLLPRRSPEPPAILETVAAHLITGSERLKEGSGRLGDYVDGCENHFLLAAAYAALAAALGGGRPTHFAAPILLFENTRRSRVIAEHRNRSLAG
jgi:hypothetical protein